VLSISFRCAYDLAKRLSVSRCSIRTPPVQKISPPNSPQTPYPGSLAEPPLRTVRHDHPTARGKGSHPDIDDVHCFTCGHSNR
jgi:hypothetical protein